MPVAARLIVAGILVSALAVTVRAGGVQEPDSAVGGIESPWPRLFSGQGLSGSRAPSGQPNPVPFPRSFTKPAVPQARAQTGASTVVCGMRIVKGDTSLDPKILHSVADISALFQMPVITPPCQGPASPDAGDRPRD
jgi:hypothetical protein